MKFFPKNSATPVAYEGGRELEDLVSFINENAGTQRTVDGGLLPTAGRIAALDSVIKAADYKVTAEVLETLKKTAADTTSANAAHVKLYLNAAEKIVAKGADYVNTELARIAKMLGGANIKPESKTNFQLRQNVLKAFTNDADSAAEEL